LTPVVLALLALLSACGRRGVGDQIALYRSEVEAALGLDAAPAADDPAIRLPGRRDRRLAVRDERIGPFDFLAILGCRLSEIVAERNNALGRVREPTRQLAHELVVVDAIEACLPTLGEERAADLRARLRRKREALPRHAWNAVWLDRDLERYLTSGARSLVGGEDARDGALQLRRAAEAIEARDVSSLEGAFAELRDDPAIAPLLDEWRSTAAALERVAAVVAGTRVAGCDRTSRRLAAIFEHRFLPYQPALGRLDRDARLQLEGIAALLRATAPTVEVPEAMATYAAKLVGDDAHPGLARRFREASLAHADAWGPILERCGVLPTAGAESAGAAPSTRSVSA
jgi:hypothetical protein